MDAVSLILPQTPRAPAAAEAPGRDSAAFDGALDKARAGEPSDRDTAGRAQNEKPAPAESPDAAADAASQTPEQLAQNQPTSDGAREAPSATPGQTLATAPAVPAVPVPAVPSGETAPAPIGAVPQATAAQATPNTASMAPAATPTLNGVAPTTESADAAPAQPAQTVSAPQAAQTQNTAPGQQTAQAAPLAPVTESAPAAPQQAQSGSQLQQQAPAQSQAAQGQPAVGAEPATSQAASASVDPRATAPLPATTPVPSAPTDGNIAQAAAPAAEMSLRATAEAGSGKSTRVGKDSAPVTGAAGQQASGAQSQVQAQTQTANSAQSAAQPSQGAAPDIRFVAAQAGADADAGLEIKPASVDTVALRSEHAQRMETGSASAAHAMERGGPRMDAAAIVRLAQQIGARAGAGSNHFEIRMDPPELGRVDVRLRIDSENRAHAVLLAERADTLSDLSRASRALERALEDAGLKLAQNGLEFGLKRDAPQHEQPRGGSPYALVDLAQNDAAAPVAAMAASLGDVTAYGFKVARAARLAVSI